MARTAYVLAALVASCTLPSPVPELGARPAALVPLDRCLADARAGAEPPALLSETGCFDALAPLDVSDELVPFAVASPLFTDGTHKQRWIGVPAGTSLAAVSEGDLSFPAGALLVKHFALPSSGGERMPVETRFMIAVEGSFRFYSYRWDEDGRDARLVVDRERAALSLHGPNGAQPIDYLFPSRVECGYCHAGGALGPTLAQLDIEVRYEGEATPDRQLAAWMDLGLFEETPPTERAMPFPSDAGAALEDRARAYLHANCAHCHRPGGFASGVDMDLRWSRTLEETRIVCVPTSYPVVAGEGMRVAPGDPDASIIARRMGAGPDDFPTMMPPIGRSIADEEGVRLVRQWIASLDPARCP